MNAAAVSSTPRTQAGAVPVEQRHVGGKAWQAGLVYLWFSGTEMSGQGQLYVNSRHRKRKVSWFLVLYRNSDSWVKIAMNEHRGARVWMGTFFSDGITMCPSCSNCWHQREARDGRFYFMNSAWGKIGSQDPHRSLFQAVSWIRTGEKLGNLFSAMRSFSSCSAFLCAFLVMSPVPVCFGSCDFNALTWLYVYRTNLV